jgi:metal-sulfur cluster biosynthetic enzyme
MRLPFRGPSRTATPSATATSPAGAPELEAIWTALRTVIDPELGRDVVTLGLVYDVTLADSVVHVTHTLTTRGCPLGQILQDGMHAAVDALPGVEDVEILLEWDPAWHPGMIARDS